MLLFLSVTRSPANSLDKVLVDTEQLDIRLAASVDILEPEIILRGEGLSRELYEYNYAHIPKLGRKYFVKSVESINAKMFKLVLEVDVLSTYADSLRGSVVRVMRGLRHGDYVDVDIRDSETSGLSVRQNVVKKSKVVMSDVTLPDDVHSNVLTVVSGDK